MRIALIGCMVMNREISHLVAQSRHVVRVWWQRQGLHDTPDIPVSYTHLDVYKRQRSRATCTTSAKTSCA